MKAKELQNVIGTVKNGIGGKWTFYLKEYSDGFIWIDYQTPYGYKGNCSQCIGHGNNCTLADIEMGMIRLKQLIF